MDTMVLQNALRGCAERTARLDVYVVHHAVNFTQAMATLRDPNNEGELCKLVGVEFVAKHERANHGMTHPSHETVRNHVRWLLKNLPPRDKPGKRSRWIGFAAGAAARIRLPKGYYTKDIADAGDIERLAMLATLPNSSRHYCAHLALGYLQGWLWAHGDATIESFRRMNKPRDEPAKAAV